MTNQQILENAISLAIDGGWKPAPNTYSERFELNKVSRLNDSGFNFLLIGKSREPIVTNDIIFNHDFAKALWGETHPIYDHIPNHLKAWQYHLQQMVIAEDPIEYLGENI